MKCKTSITLDQELLRRIDLLSHGFGSRSSLIEEALRKFLFLLERQKRDARDAEILNRSADALNKEAVNAIDFQENW